MGTLVMNLKLQFKYKSTDLQYITYILFLIENTAILTETSGRS